MAPRSKSLVTLMALACTAALTLAGCSGGGASHASIAKFCKDGAAANALDDALPNSDISDPSYLSQLKLEVTAYKNLVGEAPADIKADVAHAASDMDREAKGDTSVDFDALNSTLQRIADYLPTKCRNSTAVSGVSAASETTTTIDTTLNTTPDTSTFDTTTVPSITMPDLHNKTIDDAKAQLTSAGITSDPVIVEQKDATVAPGLVVDQSPSAGSGLTAGDAVTLTVSALPDQAYLSDLQASDGQFRTGVASIKGVPYTHGVLQSQSAGSSPQKTTFTLSSHYSRLKGVVGLDDSFTGGASVQVEIIDQDNKSLFKRTVKVGLPVTIDIPVTGVIQLTLEATDLLANVSNAGTVVWGDVRVISGS